VRCGLALLKSRGEVGPEGWHLELLGGEIGPGRPRLTLSYHRSDGAFCVAAGAEVAQFELVPGLAPPEDPVEGIYRAAAGTGVMPHCSDIAEILTVIRCAYEGDKQER